VHARFSGFYSDRFGREAIAIDYSEARFHALIRGAAFSGLLDELRPVRPLPPDAPFVFYESYGASYLSSCTFEWTMPVLLDGPAHVRAAEIACTLRIGEPEDTSQELRLVLREGGAIVAAVITEANFEDGMSQLTRESLPRGVSLRACATCRLAGYHAGEGSPFLGGLGCFRGSQAEFLAARGKPARGRMWENRTEYVLETHICPEYSARTPPVST
jgi:hypothetical protein